MMGIHGAVQREVRLMETEIVIAFYTTKALCSANPLCTVARPSHCKSRFVGHIISCSPRPQIVSSVANQKKRIGHTESIHVVLALDGPTPKLKIN